MSDIRRRVGSVLRQRQRNAFAVETKMPLTPTWVVNEWSSTLMFGSMLAVKDPELWDSSAWPCTGSILEENMDHCTHLKSLLSAPTQRTKSALSTSFRTSSLELAPI